MMKTCSKCKLEFPKTLQFFHKQLDGLKSACKVCRKAEKKAYSVKNSDKIKTTDRAYRVANREKIKAGHKIWRDANRDKLKEINKAYKKSNPEKARAHARKRIALKLGNGHIPYTETEMLERYGTVCYLCNEEIDLQAPRSSGAPGYEKSLWKEHIVAITNGGPDMLDNVKPSHAICNQRKGTKEQYENQMA